MLTRNFDQYLIAAIFSYNSTTYSRITSDYSDSLLSFKTYTGDHYHITTLPQGFLYNNVKTNDITSISSGFGSMILGSGTAEETYDDYTVTPVNGINVELVTSSTNVINNVPTTTYTRVVRNTGSSAVTVNELGIFQAFSARMNTSNATVTRVLMYRKKLDTPLVIQPNELAEIVLSFQFHRLNKPNVVVTINEV